MATEGDNTQSQEEILCRMASFMTNLWEFKDEMAAQQEEVVRIASKRSRRNQSNSLRRSGNAAQMAFEKKKRSG